MQFRQIINSGNTYRYRGSTVENNLSEYFVNAFSSLKELYSILSI